MSVTVICAMIVVGCVTFFLGFLFGGAVAFMLYDRGNDEDHYERG